MGAGTTRRPVAPAATPSSCGAVSKLATALPSPIVAGVACGAASVSCMMCSGHRRRLFARQRWCNLQRRRRWMPAKRACFKAVHTLDTALWFFFPFSHPELPDPLKKSPRLIPSPLLPSPPPAGALPLPPPSGAPSSPPPAGALPLPPPSGAPSSPPPTGAPPDPPSSLERRHPAALAIFPSAPLPPSSPERHRPATPAHGTSGPIAGLPPPRSAGGAPDPASRPVPATRPPPQPLEQPNTSTRCPGGSDAHLAPPSNPASLRPDLLPARGRLRPHHLHLRLRRCLLLHLRSQAMAAAVFTPSHHGCRSTHGRSSKLQAWMDGFRKVSFLPGWSELQIPSGPPEPAISASSSPPPLGITSSPNASSAPSDRPQREIGHGGNKTARRCAFLQHIRSTFSIALDL
ncbi:proline-rich protein 2 isoform X2 [Triticum aestivum]|uniref:proline-rich protein 2 isoform X2 n=1 Tax=Triticum aestivum TaxID=4565 RepID=UPI001D01B15F|nr:proline-rich protein 2-like isoform X2 [Triticum aestivum]XP_044424755.1 proline-rich protein 2-like isoform X2 [Triticum aestivum]XP_044424756.1 proline-rich protein 2-like isoform X2 [Triticum aestivum]XP_044424757.1 proline-rich protein 2-like isoform X2 [Triticum aestivum]